MKEIINFEGRKFTAIEVAADEHSAEVTIGGHSILIKKKPKCDIFIFEYISLTELIRHLETLNKREEWRQTELITMLEYLDSQDDSQICLQILRKKNKKYKCLDDYYIGVDSGEYLRGESDLKDDMICMSIGESELGIAIDIMDRKEDEGIYVMKCDLRPFIDAKLTSGEIIAAITFGLDRFAPETRAMFMRRMPEFEAYVAANFQ